MQRLILLLCTLSGLFSFPASGQSSYIPLGSMSYPLLDRFEIKSGRLADPEEFNTSTRSYRRDAIARYIDSFPMQIPLSKQDYFNLSYLQNDNFEWSRSENTRSAKPVLKTFYRHRAAGISKLNKDFNLVVNPVAYAQAGYDTRLKKSVFLNNRGIEVRGSINNTFGFYTQVSDEIMDPNSWVGDFFSAYNTIPGVGYLQYTSPGSTTFNYWQASGYIVVQPSKFLDMQFGHGRNFLGNGYRTFYQSDFSRDHLYLRANTHFWKINYTNIWGTLYDYLSPALGRDSVPPRHYYATTHLSLNVLHNFNVGIFQTISYSRRLGSRALGMDAQYFNPIIFYKPVENGLNSPDKTILGMDLKYNFARQFSLYGQAVISEFVLEEVLAGNGWWGNKQAYQLGLKYIDALHVNNLDLQIEGNLCRPYMYTSFNPLNAYVNYNQNMAHPLGANFAETIVLIRYQPVNRCVLKLTGIISRYGNDTALSNWGRDIRKSYSPVPKEYGNTIGQGVTTKSTYLDLTMGYMLKHNLFIDVQLAYRKTGGNPWFSTETFLITTALRWNISERRWDF